MTARRRRFGWAAAILIGAGAGLSLGYLVATRTDAGRSWLLATLVSQANGVFKGRGRLRIGRLVAISPRRVVAEAVALVDTAGVPVVSARRIEGVLSVRGLFGKAIHLRRLHVAGLDVALQQDTVGRPWNVAYLIAGDTTPSAPHAPGFGDDVRIDSLLVDGGEVRTMAPWSPHPVFQGSARDSVIAVRDSLHDLVRTPTGLYFERRRIGIERLRAHALVIVDAQQRPASLQLDSLQGSLSDPPVSIRQARGAIRWTSDSLQLALEDVRLPASRGSAAGTVAWNQPGPVRYDVTVRAQAGLADLGWVWDALPAVGQGRAVVRLRTLADPWDTEYTLDSLDVTSGPSRIQGQIAITARPADLLLHQVQLAFTPLHSDLLRRISYDALPPAVEGTFAGRLLADAGGPLRAFQLDRLEAAFTDARVTPGAGEAPAVSRLTLRGLLALGASPRATNVVAEGAQLDLRSLRALAPDAPAVDGIVTGGLTVRAADLTSADLTGIGLVWTDAAGQVSSVRGQLRTRFGREPVAVTADLAFDPLSMRALARVDPTVPLRSQLAGRVTVDGTLDSLSWTGAVYPVSSVGARAGERAALAADSLRASDSTRAVAVGGTLALRGTAALSRRAVRVTAAGTLEVFDVRAWTGRSDMPTTALGGDVQFSAQVPRDSAASDRLIASGAVAIRQLAASDRPAFEFSGGASLGDVRLRVDSAALALGGMSLTARGALARDSMGVDTLEVSVRADSLAAAVPDLRRLASTLAPVDSALAASLTALVSDTLRGDASASGYLYGSLARLDLTAAVGARAVQVGAIQVGRVVGSARAVDLLRAPAFEGAASLDEVRGVGAVRIQSAAFRVADASPDSGRLVLDVSTDDDAHLRVRGGYTARGARTAMQFDSIGLTYDAAVWSADRPLVVVTDNGAIRVEPVTLRSTQGGTLAVEATVPREGAVSGALSVVRFPIGEVAALLAGTTPFDGTLTGNASLSGLRDAPVVGWNITGDSLGVPGYHLPPLSSTGQYAERQLTANAVLRDSLGGALRAQGRLPMDLRLRSVEKRLLSDVVAGDVVADSLRLQALPLALTGVRGLQGVLTGRLGLSGTVDRPVADGTMRLDGLGAVVEALGIAPRDGHLVLRAQADSLVLESLGVRSGGVADTLGARGVLRFAANEPMRIDATVVANNFAAAQQRDGTELLVGGRIRAQGELRRPVVSGSLVIPRANLVVDPLGARAALDLNTDAARALLGADEVPVAESAAQSLSRLGELVTVEGARVDLGQEVWVQTPEARVRLTGGLDIGMSGNRLALDGEITTNRGQYRLDLGVVNRSFSIDSGRVRFFGQPEISPTLDINATNVVRVTGGSEIPVRVHIGGTYDVPVLTLTSTDPLYASAPESEIISLLVFGAPTFALDGQSQSTVRAVTGVLLPTVGGLAEGKLQQWLPKLSTLQIKTGGGQEQAQLSAGSLLDNLSISAGKQIGDRTFLRINTGVCRGTGDATGGNRLWAGLAAEYRIGPTVFGQVGVDPGAAPCTRLGGDQLPRRQFGFDLFKEWVW